MQIHDICMHQTFQNFALKQQTQWNVTDGMNYFFRMNVAYYMTSDVANIISKYTLTWMTIYIVTLNNFSTVKIELRMQTVVKTPKEET